MEGLNINVQPKGNSLKKADKSAPTTFDLSKIPSTVTNPSQKFKGISVEDEKKIYNLVNKNYGNWTDFEKKQAIQWYYNSALTSQKKKDIDTYREQVKLYWINQANDAKVGRDQNERLVRLKRADLADMIKDQLVKEWYRAKDFMNVTDDWIISWFLEANPEYKDKFTKYFYDNKSKLGNDKTISGKAPYNPNDVINLGKDLWWIEKNAWDRAKDYLEWTAETFVGWMPKRWEGIKDMLDTWWKWADFDRYVQEKYWTVPANLTTKDLAQAKKDFENVNKEQYNPNLLWWAAKAWMWLMDIWFTAWTSWLGKFILKDAEKQWLKYLSKKWINVLSEKWLEKLWSEWFKRSWKQMLKNDAFKAWFGAASQTPWVQIIPEALGDTLSTMWEQLNKLPWFKQIRESLPEKDRADWDAFVAWKFLWWARSWTKNFSELKDADIKKWRQDFNAWKWWQDMSWLTAFEKIDTQLWKWWDMLKENSKENKTQKIREKVEKEAPNQALKITQADATVMWENAQWIKILKDEGKLENIKNIDDLERNVLELEEQLKNEQEAAAKKDGKMFSDSDLWKEKDVTIVDENTWKEGVQKTMEYPLMTLINNIIDHYKSIWSSKAITYESYKRALEKWNLSSEAILKLKREGNTINNSHYNNKKNTYPNTEKAKMWAENMKEVNDKIWELDMWEEIRSRDAKLHALYTVENAIKEMKIKANNIRKWIISWPLKKRWGALWSFMNRIQFWAENVLLKLFLSITQDWLKNFGERKWTILELEDNVAKFVSDYNKMYDKIEGATSPSVVEAAAKAFIDNWKLYAPFNEDD